MELFLSAGVAMRYEKNYSCGAISGNNCDYTI